MAAPSAIPCSASRRARSTQALEASRVHRVLRELQLVASTVGDDLRPGVVGGQCLSQLRDVVLDVLGGALRRAIPPQAIDQVVRANRAIGAQREYREHRSLLASPEWERAAVDECIDAAEKADLNSHVPLYQPRRYYTPTARPR